MMTSVPTIYNGNDDDPYGRNMINYGENYVNDVKFAGMSHKTTMKGEKLVTRESNGARAYDMRYFIPTLII
jgi:hypothetical protein